MSSGSCTATAIPESHLIAAFAPSPIPTVLVDPSSKHLACVYVNSAAKQRFPCFSTVTSATAQSGLLASPPVALSSVIVHSGDYISLEQHIRDPQCAGIAWSGGCAVHDAGYCVVECYSVASPQGRLCVLQFSQKFETTITESFIHSAKEEARVLLLSQLTDELRTPLAGAIGLLDIASENVDSYCRATTTTSEEALLRELRSLLSSARACTTSVLKAITDLLQFARLERGKAELARIRIVLRPLLQEVVHMFTEEARKRSISISLSVESSVPTEGFGDRGRLLQILTAIVGNAVKFNKHNGFVRIQVHPEFLEQHDDFMMIVSVEDSGAGMEPSKLLRIYEPFFQAEESLAREAHGLGLGLPIAHHLCVAMGGWIHAQSEVGRGSTFSFGVRLHCSPHSLDPHNPAPRPSPLIAPSASPDTNPPAHPSAYSLPQMQVQTQSHAQSESDSRGRGLRPGQPEHQTQRQSTIPGECRKERSSICVLVAEDNPINQRVLKSLLSKNGYTVVMANDGQQAVDAVMEDASRFDVIIMDFQMPVLDGIEACRVIRRAGHTLPIIAHTAHALDSDRNLFLEAGMNAFLPKPVSRQALGDAIEEVLGIAEQRPAEPDAATPCSPNS
eukprot:ANDGO_00477.mRNA.1 Signal transduction histidine-protein kinase BarA